MKKETLKKIVAVAIVLLFLGTACVAMVTAKRYLMAFSHGSVGLLSNRGMHVHHGPTAVPSVLLFG